MPRIVETEVMTDQASVDAYTSMTKQQPNLVSNFLIPKLIPTVLANQSVLKIADIGCGPCGYHQELYSVYPNATIDAYDASAPMLIEAANLINPQKTTLVEAFLPNYPLPQAQYDIVWASMFLHQLPDAAVAWDAIKQLGKPGASFIVFDLMRVEDETTCWGIVEGFTPDAPQAFKQDFFNSLRASFIVSEIEQQLTTSGLTATIATKEVFTNCSVMTIQGTL
jgi:SAM-dependent methyltransferase